MKLNKSTRLVLVSWKINWGSIDLATNNAEFLLLLESPQKMVSALFDV